MVTAPDPTAGERECRYPCGCGQFPDEHCACMDGHAPAAPETDVRLTEAERDYFCGNLRQNLGYRAWVIEDTMLGHVERIVAERVRVVEGERDAARRERNRSRRVAEHTTETANAALDQHAARIAREARP